MRPTMASALAGLCLTLGALYAPVQAADASPATPDAGTAAAPAPERQPAPKGGKPGALREHLTLLKQALPPNAIEGPGSAGDGGFLQRAYPDTDIPLARIEAARTAAKAVGGRNFPSGKGRPGTFVSVGPADALYPRTPFRSSSSYVPNDYLAAGRTVALAIDPNCAPGQCRLWAAPAGGGIWRTKNALSGQPNWQYLSGPFGINAVGAITLDPNDPSGNTLWVGTGEANSCGSGCIAGVGLYKSTDGGDSWTGPYGSAAFNARGVGAIAVKKGDPSTLYAASVRAGRGVSAVGTAGVVTLVPGAPQWGLYKSTDGGQTWTFLHNGAATAAECTALTLLAQAGNGSTCSPRGVRQVELDPVDPDVVYASSFSRGVWRSADGGATWVQIKPSLNAGNASTRAMLAVNRLPNGSTRLYVAEGNVGSPSARLFRTDDARAAAPVFSMLTSSNPADPGYGSYNYCTGQCWYDNFVVSPAGHPDVVYLGGSYSYGETGNISNGRGVVLSTDGGVSFTDMTMDGTDPVNPNGLHPDQHALVVHPANPMQFFEAGDGGIVRSSGLFSNVSSWCDNRPLSGDRLTRCRQLLSRVPERLESMNKGLRTLQFQSLSVSPHNVNLVQGGTQDNGTWQSSGNPTRWINTMVGDGGQSGFDVGEPAFRFHTYFDASPDVNFSHGDMADWNWIGDPIYGHANTQFYVPIISDPKVSKTMFAGTGRTVYRTKTWGMGTMSLAEFRRQCNEWTGVFQVVCGDWVPVGPVWLTAGNANDRAGGAMAAIRRTASDTGTAWAATTTGRLFLSRNVDAEPASAVAWTRLDTLSSADPNRFVSGIHVDPANPNRAWVSYSGFSASTPATPGHVFEVVYNPDAGTATWTDRSFDLGDIPITDVARDDVTGDLYAASDFGVFRLAAGTSSWTVAAPGMPHVEVASLTIIPSARKMYVATHGLGAWLLNLP
ncbi:sialidase family protein [Ideonella sp. DXS22W]|uniref:Sialidase family protein n=1 Tax=Pseudaquabacterium inlustre TaxID=2984192 RepID=A0ABU9CHD2_9BURK